VDVDERSAQATAAEIVEKYGEGIGVAGTGISNCGPAIGLACDITDRESVSRMFRDVLLAVRRPRCRRRHGRHLRAADKSGRVERCASGRRRLASM
jgi:hypothetical protein